MPLVEQTYEVVPLDRLQPHPENPRRGDVDVLAESIDANGFYGAVIAQRSTGYVLAGNHRLLAAQHQGLDALPVVWVDVDDDRARRILLIDNRSNDLATYDAQQLLAVLGSLDGDLLGTGYSTDEFMRLVEDNEPHEYNTDRDDVPQPATGPARTALGDVWVLGRHRLACGDARTREPYLALMGAEQADLVWTDPPYGVEIVGGSHALPVDRRRKAGRHTISNDGLLGDALYEFLLAAFDLTIAATRPGAAWYVTAPHGPNGYQFTRALADLGVWKQSLVWVKDSLVLGRADYHYRHETIFYGWSPSNARLHPVTDRTQDTVWEVPRPKASADHPTMKPVALVARSLTNSLPDGGIVLDPFAGSGTTLVAAEHHGANARLIELDPKYADVVCRRFQEHTGVLPVREATGEPVDFTDPATPTTKKEQRR